MMGNYHVRCGAGEKPEVETPEAYLSLFGKIMNMVEYVSQVRKHGIRITILFQDIPQLKEKYGGESGEYWRSILSNCSINIILSCNEKDLTATHYSELMGEATIKSKQKRVQRSALTPNSPKFTYMEGEMIAQRQAVLKTDISNLDSDQHYIHIQGLGPKKMFKYDYSRHFLAKQLEQLNIIEHKPAWWKYQPQYATENYNKRNSFEIPNVYAPDVDSDEPPREFTKKDTNQIKKSLFGGSQIKKGDKLLKGSGGSR